VLATTPKGDAFTHGDDEALAREAGYAGVNVAPLSPTPQSRVEFV
jgi:hypothetical protein